MSILNHNKETNPRPGLPPMRLAKLWLLLPLFAGVIGMNTTQAQTPAIYLGATPDAPATCNCQNNATTLTNGRFSEQVTIAAPTGQTWEVTTNTGFYAVNSPAPPAPPTLIAAGTTIAETAPGSGLYRISGVHVDALGFSLTVDNGTDTLSIANTCFYPNPQIVGLANQYCTSSLPVTLTGNAGGAAGTGSFTIDGQAATVFNPVLLGPGSYVVRYTFNAGDGTPGDANDPGCTAYVQQTVVVQAIPNIATNDLINISLGPNCQANITPDMILQGFYPCLSDFVVTVYDQFGNSIGNVVTNAHVGQTLSVLVASVAGGYSGVGDIYIFDALLPSISCPENTSTAVIGQQIQLMEGSLSESDATFIPVNFSCFNTQVLPSISPHYYRLDTFTVTQNDLYIFELDAAWGRGLGAIYEGIPAFFNGPCQAILASSALLPDGIGYFPNTSGTVRIAVQLRAGQVYSIMTSTFESVQFGNFRWAVHSAGNGRLSGRPVNNSFVRSKLFCSDAATLTNNPASVAFTGAAVAGDNCGGGTPPNVTFNDQVSNNGMCGNTTITRQFTARDGSNNSATCTQTITVVKAGFQDVIFPPKGTSLTCDSSFQTTPTGNPSPLVSGRPMVYSAFGVHYLDTPFCNLVASFSDQPRVSSCAGSYQFIRRWFIFDDCNPSATQTYEQTIRVSDNTPPTILAVTDTSYYSTGANSCTGSFVVPLPTVTDNCSSTWQVLTEVITEVPVPILNPVGQVIGTSYQTQVLATILPSATDRTVSNIPMGCHRIRYTATDACGNAATSLVTFCVRDEARPTAICDDQLIMTLGGTVGTLLATDVNEGSNDYCGPVTIAVRRMVTENPIDCQPIPSPYYTAWGPSVQFTCCDAGSTMHTELRVTDAAGNQTVCITQVTVSDNMMPSCSPPNPVTVLCSNLPAGFNPNNTANFNTLFGAPQMQDNCSNTVIEELAPVVNIAPCGSGTITRRFRAVDPSGNTSPGICEQVVTIQVATGTPPVITITPGAAQFCSYNNGTCLGEANVNFIVQQPCATGSAAITVFIDLGANGSLDQDITATALTGTYPNYHLQANFPIGNHAFVIRVQNGCGSANPVQSTVPFQIVDCVIPPPTCRANLSFPLDPLLPGIDIDGDGDADAGFAIIRATDLLATPVPEGCSLPVRYSIHLTSEVLSGADVPNPAHDTLIVTCDDEGLVSVRLYAWDSAFNPLLVQPNGTVGGPNFTFCETFITVQDDQSGACDGQQSISLATVAGIIISEAGDPVEGVSLRPADNMPVMAMSNPDGTYQFNDLETGHEYIIHPQHGGNWVNGVSTIDLILISRHILNIQNLDSPYKRIAADVNGSGTITTLDLVLLRKLILGIIAEVPNQPSWRFVDANYAFPNPQNPWQEPFPQVINLSMLMANMVGEDFIAVKIGDINGSAQYNFQDTENRATGEPFLLQAADRKLEAGDVCHLTLRAPGIEGLEALQGTLQFDVSGLELIGIEHGLLQEDNIGSKELLEGMLTFSWNWPSSDATAEDERLVTLVFRATKKVELSQAIALHSGITKAEAYNEADQAVPLNLVFLPDAAPSSRIELYQNRPNPFRDETTIGFHLPEASDVRLVITDLSGKTVWELNGYYDAGKHEVEFQAERQLSAGVLLYRIEALGHTATGKMVRID